MKTICSISFCKLGIPVKRIGPFLLPLISTIATGLGSFFYRVGVQQ